MNKDIEKTTAETVFLSFLHPMNFLLSFLIVLHHSFTVNISYNGSYSFMDYGWTIGIQRLMYNVSECAVPVFFYLSAFLFFRTFDGSIISYRKKMKRRFYSLFIPYVFFCTFGYMKHLVAIEGEVVREL